MIEQLITAGDTICFPILLKKDNVTFTISQNAVVKAAITDKRFSKLVSPVILVTEIAGSDWANSKIMFMLNPPDSDNLPVGEAGIEVEIVDNGVRQTWQVQGLKINRSLIS